MAIGINWGEIWKPVWKAVWTNVAPTPPAETVATGGHAYLSDRFARARKRIALQRALDYLTNPKPSDETKRVIREIKAGKPVPRESPPAVMAEVSAEKLAPKLIPERVAELKAADIDLQRVILRALELAQQDADDEDVLLLMLL